MLRSMSRPIAAAIKTAPSFAARSQFTIAPVGSRFFSSKAPIKLQGESGQYAHALMDAIPEYNKDASKKISAHDIANSLSTWKQASESNAQLRMYIQDPTVSPEAKSARLAKEVYPTLDIDPVTGTLIGMCFKNKNLNLLDSVSNDFGRLVAHESGVVEAEVVSANKLSSKQQSKIEQKLKGQLEKGETLSVSYAEDDRLIGGLTVKLGTKFQDLSVATSIKKVEMLLRAA